MGNPPFLRLAPELHLQVALHLTEVESTLLSLTCKHLYCVYPTHKMSAWPLETLSPSWKSEAEQEPAVQWLSRMMLLRSLISWMQNIDRRLLRDDCRTPITLSICVACAQFKPRDDTWIKGWRYGDFN